MKLQDIHLKSGIEVTVDWGSKKKCECGAEIWFALTKNKKLIPIELVGLSEWETHFATCPLAEKFRNKTMTKEKITVGETLEWLEKLEKLSTKPSKILHIRNLLIRELSLQKQEIVEEIERIRAESHNGHDVYNELVWLIEELKTPPINN